jgi:hypothetical protein
MEMGKGSEVTGLKRILVMGRRRKVWGWLVLSREEGVGARRLRAPPFIDVSEDCGASATTLAVIQVMAAFGMFTSRYLRVRFEKKSIASPSLMIWVIWSRILTIPPFQVHHHR